LTNFTRLFWLWLIARTLVWILAVVASHPNAPLDLVEWLSWGGVWQWGYCKHPPLPAWMADVASRVDPGHVWPVYVLSYSIIALLLVAVWKLAREYLPVPLALAAVICQDGQMYFTNDGAEFSNNVVLNAGWAWLILCVHRAIFRRSLGWWIGVGVILGATALAKYTIAIPILVLVGFSICTRSTWPVSRTPGPYLAAIIAIALFAPHAVWLVRHDFLPLKYAAERSTEEGGFERHFTFPIQFVGGQLIQLLPVFLILLPMLTWKLRREPVSPERRFLVWAILGPFAFLLVLSLTTGLLLREIWGSPLWAFAGIGYLAFFRRADAEVRLKWVGIAWALIGSAILIFCVGKQQLGPELTGKPERPHFPGRALADEVNRRWGEKYGGVPPIIGGEGWRAGNICCYSDHRPKLYSSGRMDYLVMDPKDSPGTSDAEVNARGAAIVWDPEWLGGETLRELKARFPALEVQPEIELPYAAHGLQKSARTGVAFIPPSR
jgi:4-amino-4-deoxy-L-arabinose transferase-like glycosyltransferase